ncbi:MAG TPA: DUF4476 domain-containing protein [Myxococcaceae bacterium]|nr:DUF4476 domain-containing protein [Myxococcaceae bacterium]
MKNALTALLILASAQVWAQSVQIKIDPNHMGMSMDVQDAEVTTRSSSRKVEEHTENSHKIRYESNADGKTLLRVLHPEGAHVDIYDGTNSWASEDIPMSVEGRSDTFYRFVVRFPNGALFEKKLQAKRGMTMSLWVRGPNSAAPAVVVVHQPPPPAPEPVMAPSPIGSSDFAALKAAIQGENFSEEKLGVLQTAADSHWFTAAQVGELVDLYNFSDDKIGALTAVKSRIVDRNNNFKIIGKFTFSDDKKRAQELLR